MSDRLVAVVQFGSLGRNYTRDSMFNLMFKKFLSQIVALCLLGLCHVRANDVHPIISVTSPPYCSDIQGDTEIRVSAPGQKHVEVECWQAGEGYGSEARVGTIEIDDGGKGSIKFPADDFPHGPITITLSCPDDDCYLQVYNKGGKPWNEGIPKNDPPGAKGMKLVYSDDFSTPLDSTIISSKESGSRYYDHKPPHGTQDFSSIPFRGYTDTNDPFSQVDTYLRIRCDAKKGSTGLISSENDEGKGFKIGAPCYFECRFIAPNFRGSWPAFWLLSDYMAPGKDPDKDPCDELDIIEAFGGEGPDSPNAKDLYCITPHAWNQEALKKQVDKYFKDMGNPVSPRMKGIPSTWCRTFHTYGVRIMPDVTTYYYDNVEMCHHKTLPISQKYPLFFLINLATGGGWPVDLSRYGKGDMYVDWVRVYGTDASPREVPKDNKAAANDPNASHL